MNQSSSDAEELSTVLARLGLDQYEERLTENGFETWEMLTSITEADLKEMDFRLGHRRKLQRAIYEYQNGITNQPHCTVANLSHQTGGLPVIGVESLESQNPSAPPKRTKRQYRRHPQPDHNAPRRPKTAYVAFTEHIRKDPDISRLSFAEIAKEVGLRWGNLSYEARFNVWEKPAADRMLEYEVERDKYQRTDSYHSYQEYLNDFRQRQRKRELAETSNTKVSIPSRSLREPEAAGQVDSDQALTSSSSHSASNTPPQRLTSPVESGLEEVHKILSHQFINPQYSRFTALPPEDMTNVAVEAFLHGTGSLLSLWDHDEAIGLVRSVYHPHDDLNYLDKTEVLALATIGSFCDSEAVTSSIPENFLHLFLSMLVSSSDISDLHYMRLFTCLAVCRFTENVESARTLICR
jgi:hypothetical protein